MKNLIKYVKLLTRYRDGKKIDMGKAFKEIEHEKNIADIGWLKEKLNELK